MNTMQPIGSMRLNFDISGSLRSSLSVRILRKIDSITSTTAPIGRLLASCKSKPLKFGREVIARAYIQKHHLHVLCSVNAPPSGGPALVATAKTLMTTPIYTGRLSSGTTWLITLSAPCRRPAAPRPAMALPTMKTVEDWATAQIIDPTALVS
jgi:hypothetical protein